MRKQFSIFIRCLWVFLLISTGLQPAVTGMSASMPVSADESSPIDGFVVQSSKQDGLQILFNLPEVLSISSVEQLNQVETAFVNTSNGYRLPVLRALVAVPPGAVPQLAAQVVERGSLPIRGDIPAAQLPANLDQSGTGMQAGELEDASPQALEALSRAGGLTDTSSPVILEDAGWWRDLRLARLTVFPFHVDSASQTLQRRDSIDISITFPGANPEHAFSPEIAALISASILNADEAVRFADPDRARQLAAQASYANPDFARPGIHLSVVQNGLYQVTYTDLINAGISVAGINPQTLRLTSLGEEIAIVWQGDGDAAFESGESILFYGEALDGEVIAARSAEVNDLWNEVYLTQLPSGLYSAWEPQFNAEMIEKVTRTNVYWLQWGGTAGPLITSQPAPPNGGATPQTFTETIHFEQDEHWRTTTFTGEDTWFWDYINTGELVYTRTYSVDLPGLAAASGLTATLTVELIGHQNSASQSPDHQADFTLGNAPSPVITAAWDGISRFITSGTVDQSYLAAGTNTLELVAERNPALFTSRYYFDSVTVAYQRQFMAVNDTLLFTLPAGMHSVAVDGFTSNQISVYDVSTPSSPVLLTGTSIEPSGMNYRVRFGVDVAEAHRYIAVANTGQVLPATMRTVSGADLIEPANQADMLIIAAESFQPVTQAWADYRATVEGWTVQVVDLDDIYHQFNDGIAHPIAIYNFLAYVYANWQAPQPVNVLLIGDGHWNFHGGGLALYGTPDPISMPPNLAWVDPWQGEVDSANLLVTVVGVDALPEYNIGRIPVSTTDELTAVLNKIRTVEQQTAQAWHDNWLIVADDTPDPAGNFPADGQAIVDQYVGPLEADALLLLDTYDTGDNQITADCDGIPGSPTSTCPQATTALMDGFNSGALFYNYFGHGSVNRWAHESLMIIGQIPNLTNAAKPGIALSWTCLDGYWIHASQTSSASGGTGLIEEMLRHPTGGISGAFSPTGLGVATGHTILADGFFTGVITQSLTTLGGASLAAKQELFSIGAAEDLMHTFTVFGDPAMRLPTVFTPAAPARKMVLLGSEAIYEIQLTNTGFRTSTISLSVDDDTIASVTPSSIQLVAGQSTTIHVRFDATGAYQDGQILRSELLAEWSDPIGKSSRLPLSVQITGQQIYLPLLRR